MIGAGVEAMSRPARNGTDGFHANNEHLLATNPQVPQGLSADLIATLDGWTREQCDALGLESQRRAAVALEEGRFDRSLITIVNDDGTVALDHEEYPRPSTTAEGPRRAGAELPEDGRLLVRADRADDGRS